MLRRRRRRRKKRRRSGKVRGSGRGDEVQDDWSAVVVVNDAVLGRQTEVKDVSEEEEKSVEGRGLDRTGRRREGKQNPRCR